MSKKMILEFDESVYERIPKPKRTWVMEKLDPELKALMKILDPDQVWVFEFTDGHVVRGKGETAMLAWEALGYPRERAYDRSYLRRHYAAESEVDEKVESEWAFRTDKGVEVSRGASAKEAWTALGYEGINMDYLPRAEAEAQRWFEEAKGNPLDL